MSTTSMRGGYLHIASDAKPATRRLTPDEMTTYHAVLMRMRPDCTYLEFLAEFLAERGNAEPVAWLYEDGEAISARDCDYDRRKDKAGSVAPLYARPVPAAEPTKAQIEAMRRVIIDDGHTCNTDGFYAMYVAAMGAL